MDSTQPQERTLSGWHWQTVAVGHNKLTMEGGLENDIEDNIFEVDGELILEKIKQLDDVSADLAFRKEKMLERCLLENESQKQLLQEQQLRIRQLSAQLESVQQLQIVQQLYVLWTTSMTLIR